MNKSRQQFEEHCKDKKLPLESINNGVYSWGPTRIAWEAWQASRESLEVELPVKIPTLNYETFEEGLGEGYNNAIDDFKQILISNGVKIKNE